MVVEVEVEVEVEVVVVVPVPQIPRHPTQLYSRWVRQMRQMGLYIW